MRRRLSLILAAALFSQAACFGSFGLTVKVWEFNRSVGNKWVQEVLFLALVIIPVYQIASLVDALVLNSVEFWTGSNPTAALEGDENNTRIVSLPDGTELKMVREGVDSMRVEHEGVVHHFVRTAEGFQLLDAKGDVVSSVQGAVNGDVVVTSASGETVYGAEELFLAGSSSTSVAAWAMEQVQARQQGTLALH